MLTEKTLKKLEGIKKCTLNGRVKNLFQIITNSPDLWLQAYGKIAANYGAMTPGVTGSIVDGFSNEVIDKILFELKQGQYNPNCQC